MSEVYVINCLLLSLLSYIAGYWMATRKWQASMVRLVQSMSGGIRARMVDLDGKANDTENDSITKH